MSPESDRKKTRLIFARADADTAERLEARARAEGTSVSRLVRLAVRCMLDGGNKKCQTKSNKV